jgi:uncharacterized protein (TIGR03086 family)
VVDQIKPDQLGQPALCTESTVRDVINHVTGEATMSATCVEEGSISDEAFGAPVSGDNLGGDYKGAFKAATGRAVAAFETPGSLDKIVKLPFGEMPAGVALTVAVFDGLTHAADLAKATGQQLTDAEPLETARLPGAR